MYAGLPGSICLIVPVFAALIVLFAGPTASALDDASVVSTFQVNHASVRQLEPIIRPLLSSSGSLSVDERTNSIIVRDTESGVRILKETLAKLDAPMPSHTFNLNYANADDVAEKITRILGTSGGLVEPDTRTHTVFVMTTPSNLEHIRSLVPGWDKPARQVFIEADILDVSSAKLKELGVEWELRLGYDGSDHDAVINVGTQRSSTDTPATGAVSLGTPSVTIPAVFDAAGNLIAPAQTLPGSDFSATIEALIEDSSTKTLSRPRILVLDGHPARFEVSTLEPYANTHYSPRGIASSLEIEFLDIGIILEAVPHINEDGYIMMDIRPEISTLVREEFFDTTIIPDEGGAITNSIRVPVKSQSRATTMVMVRDNQTIAIGGLRTHEDTEEIRKVPLLGDIPVLGIPFRNLNQSRDNRELVIFITPHITSGAVSSPEANSLRQIDVPEKAE